MIRLAFLLTVFSCCFAAVTLAADPADEAGYYMGTLGGRHPITMVLGNHMGDSVGRYRYLQHGPFIWLTNEKAAADEVLLSETEGSSNTVVGHFHGEIDEQHNFTGTWKSEDAKRSLPFNLHRIAELAEYSVHEPRFSVEYSIPQFVSKSSFYVALNQKLTAAAKREEHTTAAEYRKSTTDPDGGPYPWTSSTTVEVLYADDTMVSLLYQVGEYTGGAHENVGFTARTFLWQDDKVIELRASDLISADSTSTIGKLIVHDLKHQQAGWPDGAGKVDLDTVVINPTVGGLMFTYSPYEVGSFAEGAYTVMLPYSSVKKAIPSDSPLVRLARSAANSQEHQASINP